MKRDFNLDLIRSVAVTSVLAVHFFLNTGFYDFVVDSFPMLLATMLRTFFMVCVPLFLLLTGYLQGRKRWNGAYWKGLGKILIPYVLATLLCLGYRVAVGREFNTPYTWLQGFFEFSGAPYAWYVEMYLGLYLLLPFLNVLWDSLNKEGRKALLGVLLFLTVLPTLDSFTQAFKLNGISQWWMNLYPVTYYIIGRWLRTYPLHWNRWLCFFGAVLWSFFGGFAQGIYSWMNQLNIGYTPATYWNGIFPMVSSVLLFVALRREHWNAPPKQIQWVVGRIASLSLPIFLVSWLVDQFLYPPIVAHFSTMGGRLPWILLTVPVSLFLSTCLARLLTYVQNAITYFGGKLLHRN